MKFFLITLLLPLHIAFASGREAHQRIERYIAHLSEELSRMGDHAVSAQRDALEQNLSNAQAELQGLQAGLDDEEEMATLRFIANDPETSDQERRTASAKLTGLGDDAPRPPEPDFIQELAGLTRRALEDVLATEGVPDDIFAEATCLLDAMTFKEERAAGAQSQLSIDELPSDALSDIIRASDSPFAAAATHLLIERNALDPDIARAAAEQILGDPMLVVPFVRQGEYHGLYANHNPRIAVYMPTESDERISPSLLSAQRFPRLPILHPYSIRPAENVGLFRFENVVDQIIQVPLTIFFPTVQNLPEPVQHFLTQKSATNVSLAAVFQNNPYVPTIPLLLRPHYALHPTIGTRISKPNENIPDTLELAFFNEKIQMGGHAAGSSWSEGISTHAENGAANSLLILSPNSLSVTGLMPDTTFYTAICSKGKVYITLHGVLSDETHRALNIALNSSRSLGSLLQQLNTPFWDSLKHLLGLQ